MKRLNVFFILILVMFSTISCAVKPAEPLPENSEADTNTDLPPVPETSFPYVNEQLFHVEDSEALVIPFELTEAGYFKFIAYDATEYEVYTDAYWDNMPEFQLSFYDETEQLLYENINITDGCDDAYFVDSAKITAKITYSGSVENLSDIMVSWAFAPKEADPVLAPLNLKVAAKSDETQTARFSFKASENALYRFSCFEACLWENDCYFTITNVDGTVEADNLFMHGTEWNSRLAFLLEGEYIITVNEVPYMATCLVTLEESYDSIVTSDFGSLELPATLGFTTKTISPCEIHFTADGSNENLSITTAGINSYYDYQQSYDLVIKESTGNIILSEESVEGDSVWDISEYSGEYIITITPYENGIMKIEVN